MDNILFSISFNDVHIVTNKVINGQWTIDSKTKKMDKQYFDDVIAPNAAIVGECLSLGKLLVSSQDDLNTINGILDQIEALNKKSKGAKKEEEEEEK